MEGSWRKCVCREAYDEGDGDGNNKNNNNNNNNNGGEKD